MFIYAGIRTLKIASLLRLELSFRVLPVALRKS